MTTAHDHRLRALEMLLRSMRTRDRALNAAFERLSEVWLALARERERLDGPARAASILPGPLGAWKPIDTTPRQHEILVMATAWGPRIWLRDKEHAARGRWRVEGPQSDLIKDTTPLRDAQWEDLDGEPLAFAPTEWREIDG